MNILKLIGNIFYILILAFIFLMASSLILSRFNTPIAYKLYTVTSGSMEPAIKVGSVILVKPQSEYRENDIVNYRSENNPTETVTHRIIDISRDIDLNKVSFRTKGDANNTADPELINSSRVTGKVFLSLPYLGYPVAFAQTQTGLITLIIIPATLIIYSELVSIKNEIAKMIKGRKVTKIEKIEKKKKEKPPSSGKKFIIKKDK